MLPVYKPHIYVGFEPTLNHFCGRPTICQWSNESPTRWRRWRSRFFRRRRQHTWTTWSSPLFLFGLCDLLTPRCCLLQEHELNSHGGHSELQLHTPGTRYRLTLDLVTLYTPLKNTSKHTCLDSLSLKPPAPLYPLQGFKALYKYCIIIIIIIICMTMHWPLTS